MKSNENSKLAEALSFKGGLSIDEKKYDDALKYFTEASLIFESIVNYSGMASSFNNIGLALSKKSEHDIAFDYFLKALNLVKTKTFSQLQLADIESNIGYSYYEMGDIKPAIKHWKEVLKIYVNLNCTLEKKYKVISNILLSSQDEDWNNLKEYFFDVFSKNQIKSSKNIKITSNCKKDIFISNKQYYSCKVFIDNEPDVLDDILIVIYKLHPTFPIQYQQPVLYSIEENNFPIALKCWGSFEIDIFIIFKNNSCSEYSHNLNIYK